MKIELMRKRLKRIQRVIIPIVLIFAMMPSLAIQGADNDAPSTWAEAYIESAMAMNVFGPKMFQKYQSDIKREDVAFLAVRTYERITGTRVDVGDDDNPEMTNIYVRRAIKVGLMQGYEDGSFRKSNPIKRDELAVVLKRLIDITEVYVRPDSSGSIFIDDDSIPSWAKDSVYFAKYHGLLMGYENSEFRPEKYISKEETIVIMLRTIWLVEQVDYLTNEIAIDSFSYSPGEGVISEHGALKVHDSQLVDQNNEPIQLRGLSTHGFRWYSDFITNESISKFRDEWNVDVIRFALYSPAEWRSLNTLRELQRCIDIASEEGMYVIIDWHDDHNDNPLDSVEEAKVFFSIVSDLYRHHDNVLYEIYNETSSDFTWEESLKPYSEQVIPVIREHDEDAIIIVPTPSWGQEVDKVVGNELDFDNVMYSLHYYASNHQFEHRLTARYALNNGIPLFATEWGTAIHFAEGDDIYEEESDKWMELLNSYNVSWCNWSLSDKDETSAIFLPGVNPSEGWIEGDLTDSGKYVKGILTGDN